MYVQDFNYILHTPLMILFQFTTYEILNPIIDTQMKTISSYKTNIVNLLRIIN